VIWNTDGHCRLIRYGPFGDAKNLDNLSIAKRSTSTKLHNLGTMITKDTTDYDWTTGGVKTLVHQRVIFKSDIGQVHEVCFEAGFVG
jgi:hypothetical protein